MSPALSAASDGGSTPEVARLVVDGLRWIAARPERVAVALGIAAIVGYAAADGGRER